MKNRIPIHIWSMTPEDTVPPHLENETQALRAFIDDLLIDPRDPEMHQLYVVRTIKMIVWLRWVFEREKDNPPDLTEESIANSVVSYVTPKDQDAAVPDAVYENGELPDDISHMCFRILIPRTQPFKALLLSNLADVYKYLTAAPVSVRKGSRFLRVAEEVYALISGGREDDLSESMHQCAREYRSNIEAQGGYYRRRFIICK